jgi:hypothetical protein
MKFMKHNFLEQGDIITHPDFIIKSLRMMRKTGNGKLEEAENYGR